MNDVISGICTHALATFNQHFQCQANLDFIQHFLALGRSLDADLIQYITVADHVVNQSTYAQSITPERAVLVILRNTFHDVYHIQTDGLWVQDTRLTVQSLYQDRFTAPEPLPFEPETAQVRAIDYALLKGLDPTPLATRRLQGDALQVVVEAMTEGFDLSPYFGMAFGMELLATIHRCLRLGIPEIAFETSFRQPDDVRKIYHALRDERILLYGDKALTLLG